MNYLIQGGESEQRFDLLLSLTKISSKNVIDALRDHLVVGLSDITAAGINGVPRSNFSRALAALNKTAETVEQIKAHDWAKFKNQLSDNNRKE